MKRFNPQFWLWLASFLTAFAIFWQEPAHALEPAQIMAWVARRLDITDAFPLPAVIYADKSELQAVFTRANRNSYLRWEADFGPQEAERILNIYLQELAGIYDPNKKAIYVGRFLPPCRQEAILAHELTHYLQVNKHGKVDPGSDDAEGIQHRREMKATLIEQRYSDLFCDNKSTPGAKPIP